mgnify:FL=1|tara:strand:+ start:6014 stop:6787 length:774 start_codon:yes stop_codon:yes gene_type:complete
MPPPKPFDLDKLARSANAAPNRFVGVRLDRNRVFLPEAGNTVVRHVVPGSETEAALIELRKRLRDLPWGHRFAFTDVESLHMTVFNGVIETCREPGFWPQELALDLPIEAVTDYLAARLDGFSGPGPFDMRIAEVTPYGLTLTGATEADEKTARAWRDALTGPFTYRAPKHDAYTFHVTLAYLIDWLPDDMVDCYRQALAELTGEFRQRIPVVELGPPAFCTFEDMNGFPPVMTLEGTGLEPVLRTADEGLEADQPA